MSLFSIEEILTDIKENNIPISKVYKKYGGVNIYIPRIDPNYKEKVLKEFNGYNQCLLADKYNVSLSQIYSITKKKKQSIKQRIKTF